MGGNLSKSETYRDIQERTRPKPIKLVIVGDKKVGKTCLLTCYMQKTFSQDLNPSAVLNVFNEIRSSDGKLIDVLIQDTLGDPDLGVNRQAARIKADCFLLCISVGNRNSLSNAQRWRNEIRYTCPDQPIIMIATKSDLRAVATDALTLDELKCCVNLLDLQAVVETSSKEW